MDKITREVATNEINGWLDKKKVYDATRETNRESIEILIEAMTKGDLSLNDKGEFTHKLLFPDALNGAATEFKYKARLNDDMVRSHKQGIKANDFEGMWAAYGAALTAQPKKLINLLDSADKKIFNAIVVFFV